MWKNVFIVLLLYLLYKTRKPKPVRSLKLSYWRDHAMANHAHVTAKWTASVTPGIVSQHVKVTVGDAAPVEADLTPDVLTYEFDAPEKTHVEIVVTAFDGVLSSDAVTSTLDIPALTPPAPVTDLGMTFVSVPDAPPVTA